MVILLSSKIPEHVSRLPDVDFETLKHNRHILSFLGVNGASYPAELAWNLNVAEFQVNFCLRSLLESGFVEAIPVHFTCPDARLVGRVVDQSNRGQGGFANFSRKRWFGLTPAGVCEWEKNKSANLFSF